MLEINKVKLDNLVFVAFNSRVIALNRHTGEEVWAWKAPKGTASYVASLLDDDRLIVSVSGYTYCLEPLSGAQIWENHLKGKGMGTPSLVSINGNSSGGGAAAVAAQRQQAASGGAGGY